MCFEYDTAKYNAITTCVFAFRMCTFHTNIAVFSESVNEQ